MSWALDPAESWLRVWTHKGGLLARAAHDLCLESRGLRVELTRQASSVSLVAVVPVGSLRVLGQVLAGGRVEPLKPSDHAEIEDNLRGPRVLDAARHPEVRWEGTGALGAGAEARCEGRLTVRGATLALPVRAALREEAGGVRAQGQVELRQTLLGITPFSALLGALKVQDEVQVSWSLFWPGAKLGS